MTAAFGAAAVLIGHGSLFVVAGLLAESGLIDMPDTLSTSVLRWYTFLWGPWFIMGGVLFLLAGRDYRQAVAGGSMPAIVGLVGGIAVLALTTLSGVV